MKERAILYSPSMVQARRAGLKTQTRRIVKLPYENPLGKWEPGRFGGPNGGRTAKGETIPEQGVIWHTRTGMVLGCPLGCPGDHLWVREAWRTLPEFDAMPPRDVPEGVPLWFEADGPAPEGFGRYRHARFMCRWMSRGLDMITDSRAELLHDITPDDARAEGVTQQPGGWWSAAPGQAGNTARAAYGVLWNSINGDGSWDANPLVWRITFEVVK